MDFFLVAGHVEIRVFDLRSSVLNIEIEAEEGQLNRRRGTWSDVSERMKYESVRKLQVRRAKRGDSKDVKHIR